MTNGVQQLSRAAPPAVTQPRHAVRQAERGSGGSARLAKRLVPSACTCDTHNSAPRCGRPLRVLQNRPTRRQNRAKTVACSRPKPCQNRAGCQPSNGQFERVGLVARTVRQRRLERLAVRSRLARHRVPLVHRAPRLAWQSIAHGGVIRRILLSAML